MYYTVFLILYSVITELASPITIHMALLGAYFLRRKDCYFQLQFIRDIKHI